MRTVLITGASSGIGEQFAEAFAKRGYYLILTGRNKKKLEGMVLKYRKQAKMIVADLSDEKECKRLLTNIENVDVDVFINNAGFGTCGSFVETSLETELEMIKVNDVAMHILFKGLLQKMEKRHKGVIVNVASSAGLLPAGPYMATYYASKAYVTSLTRAVAAELRERKSKVYVCALCPGPVNTNFNDRAQVKFSLPGISAKTCVEEAFRGMQRRQTIIVPTRKMRWAMVGQKFLNEKFLVKLTGYQQKKKM